MKTINKLSRQEMKSVLGGLAIPRCNASLQCPDGSTISCQCETGTCTAGADSVTCDCDGNPEVKKSCTVS